MSELDDTLELDYPKMPDLASPHFHFRHTVHSALESLSRLAISSPRITIRMAGPGWRPDWVVAQEPPPGTPLRPDTIIQLWVAGLGFFHNLPVGMWERGGDGAIGTQELTGIFDDPLQKARHWVREGARVFDLHPDNRTACGRWIALFGFDPQQWPEATWYELALLSPALYRLAGTEQGVRKALKQLVRLDLYAIRPKPHWLWLEAADLSRLGARSSELGFNLILGDRRAVKRAWDVCIGPVHLDRYFEMQAPDNQQLLQRVFRLCVPFDQAYDVSWHVLNPERAPRLGYLEANSCLGINSWVGPVVGNTDAESWEPAIPRG
jgi:hypothetical protein